MLRVSAFKEEGDKKGADSSAAMAESKKFAKVTVPRCAAGARRCRMDVCGLSGARGAEELRGGKLTASRTAAGGRLSLAASGPRGCAPAWPPSWRSGSRSGRQPRRGRLIRRPQCRPRR
jgi:hypothetical protein